MAIVDPGRTGLYRLYDIHDRLLYIGIATTPETRWTQHALERTWWPEVAHKAVEWHPTRADAERAEVAAIVAESPHYNVSHSTTRRRGDARGEYIPRYSPVRRMRVASEEWRAFGLACKAAGTTRAEAVRDFIRWYLRRPGAKPVARPDAGPWSEAPPAS